MCECLNCGERITKQGNKFCNHSCAATFNNKKRGTLINCNYCGVETKNYKFCSKKCSTNYIKTQTFNRIENGDLSLYHVKYKEYLIFKHGNKCMECGWNKINITTGLVPIQLEHIDGNSDNNELSNLKLLCPNCHSLTSTFGALNKGNGRKNRYKKNNNVSDA